MADDTHPTDDAAKTGGNPMHDAAQRASDTMRRAGEAMRASGQKVADGSAALGLKIIEQAERNSHDAFEAMREAAQARDVTDVLRIQGNYLRRQGERSMEQAREIGEMILRFGRDAVTPPKSGD
jgi:hypothetical protein